MRKEETYRCHGRKEEMPLLNTEEHVLAPSRNSKGDNVPWREQGPCRENKPFQINKFPKRPHRYGPYCPLESSYIPGTNSETTSQTRMRITYNANPVMNKNIDMRGNVHKSKFRRPKVSIVYIAGNAKRKLITPNPKEARRAWIWVNFASTKMFAYIL